MKTVARILLKLLPAPPKYVVKIVPDPFSFAERCETAHEKLWEWLESKTHARNVRT